MTEDDDLSVAENPIELSENKKCGDEPGLIYISYIPPNMTPLHIRQLFQKYGDVGRIYFQPEEIKNRHKNIKPKYNKGSFTEGWVEMGSKKLAKRLALTLNNTLIEDCGKRSKFADHLWNVKYLHRFRWRHLTERLAHEREVRKQRMRVELAQARRETAAFVASAETDRKVGQIRARQAGKGAEWSERRKSRSFRQRKTVAEIRRAKADQLSARTDDGDDKTTRVFKQIFS